MEITREDLNGFLWSIGHGYFKLDRITPSVTAVMTALEKASADISGPVTITVVDPTPPANLDDIPF